MPEISNPTSAYNRLIMANHYREKIDGDISVASEITALLEKNPRYSEGFKNPNPK